MTQSGSLRRAAVAGRFYPSDPKELRAQVAAFLRAPASPSARRLVAAMAPHAGYVYSGRVAGEVFARALVPERVVVLCPNHTGRGARVSVFASGAFELPGGRVPIDEQLARRFLELGPDAREDTEAHRAEHAIEVELPFLLARQPQVRIVPVVLARLSAEEAIDLGRALYRAACDVGEEVLVVASSDMSHYLPETEARTVDQVALEPLLAFDPARLYRTVREQQISMCGFIPATAMLAYAREAGASKPELVSYATSGDAFGERERVVGYAGVVVS
jgi:AmmeMemoRadiSam system protein B